MTTYTYCGTFSKLGCLAGGMLKSLSFRQEKIFVIIKPSFPGNNILGVVHYSKASWRKYAFSLDLWKQAWWWWGGRWVWGRSADVPHCLHGITETNASLEPFTSTEKLWMKAWANWHCISSLFQWGFSTPSKPVSILGNIHTTPGASSLICLALWPEKRA